MGTTAETVPAFTGGSPKNFSLGGTKVARVLAKHTMGATYATGGDTITLPPAPAGGTLFCVSVLGYTQTAAAVDILWDGSVVTPKLKVYVETTGTSAELANGNAGQAATVVFLEFIYTIGR